MKTTMHQQMHWTMARRAERLNPSSICEIVRAKRATTAGRQARSGEDVPRTARPGLVACCWRHASARG